MPGQIKLSRLRELLNKCKNGLQDDDPESYLLADRVVVYCRQARLSSPYDGRVFSELHLGKQAYTAWHSNTARNYFAEQLAQGGGEVDEPEVPIWMTAGTVGFDLAAANLFQPHFILAAINDEPLQLYEIEDQVTRQVKPIVANKADTRVLMGGVALAQLHADGVGTDEKLLDAIILSYHTMVKSRGLVCKPPVLLGQPDDTEWCLHRATYRPDASVPWPLFRKFTDRLNDATAFGAWLWGCYSGHNRGRQILYISDKAGVGGKSKLISTLVTALFGSRISHSYPSNAIAAKNPHASAAFVGKRLVVVGDNTNPWLLHSGMLKELSGDDMSFINQKYKQPFSTHLQCRVIVLGNVEPAIIREAHNTSRTLWLSLAPLVIDPNERDPDYGAKCLLELPGVLAWAQRCYAERGSGLHGDFAIEVNDAVKEAVEQRIRVCESMYSVPFEQYFTLDPKGTCTAKEFAELENSLRMGEYRAASFRDWIMAVYPQVSTVIDSKRATGWHLAGVRLKAGSDWQQGVGGVGGGGGGGARRPPYDADEAFRDDDYATAAE